MNQTPNKHSESVKRAWMEGKFKEERNIFPELRLAIDNGRTLCVTCHKTTDSYLNSYGRN